MPQTQPDQATPQEKLWRGEFGDQYVGRNGLSDEKLALLTAHWAKVLGCLDGEPPKSILEVGANIGLNLRAMRRLTTADFYAVEPNATARGILTQDGVVPAERVLDSVASDIALPDASVDLAFTCTVLIHVHPDDLLAACREIHRVSRRYVVCVEYFADSVQEVPYRGNRDALFKRDFGSFYLDNFPDLKLVDYGFAWKRLTSVDNCTWWVFEKKS
jgi:pseudaminic acid biosynthesis-associated methylase